MPIITLNILNDFQRIYSQKVTLNKIYIYIFIYFYNSKYYLISLSYYSLLNIV